VDILERDSDFTTIGGRIRYYRLKQGLTMDKLSIMAGLSKSLLIRYENNRVSQTLDACNSIAEVLHIEPDLLYDDYLKFITTDYGERIRLARMEAGISQIELGYKLSMTGKTIGRWEHGKLAPSRNSYQVLISVLALARL
jgi:transcriptional regulator with XRE-family HTH domain